MNSRSWSAVLTVLLALGCRTDMAAWRSTLAAANANRLSGLWLIRLRIDGGADKAPPAQANGQIALTLNEERMGASTFGQPPMLFGTYDLDFRPLGLSTEAYVGMPEVECRLRGDTVDLKLAPESRLPVELTGVIRDDSITGRWSAHQRAGPDGLGEFTLRRP